jgi:hypothetical protein
MKSLFKVFFQRVFGIDPVLLDAQERNKRIEATMNGERDWMFVCRPLDFEYEKKIECNDKNIYIRMEKKT